jgi:hypothetical protein
VRDRDLLETLGQQSGNSKNVVAPTLKTMLVGYIHKNLHRTSFQSYHHVAIREHGTFEGNCIGKTMLAHLNLHDISIYTSASLALVWG